MSTTEAAGQAIAGPEKLPRWRLVMFALGQMGWSLASFGAGNLINYFYVPPETAAGATFPVFIFPGIVFLGLTIIGLVNGAGRLLDAFTNPLIATWSDRSASRFGRRRTFMAIALVPFAVFSVLIFVPIQPIDLVSSAADTILNAVWFAGCLFVFYFFFVMYATPYTALISELGHSPNARLTISTAISVTWALGFLAGQGVYALKGVFEGPALGLPPTQAFQLVQLLAAVLAAALMLLPVLFIDERRFAKAQRSTENLGSALRSTLRNRNYRRYVLSELFYFICLTLMQSALVYFVTVLLRLEEGTVTLLAAVMFFTSFLWYPLVVLLAKRIGKRRLLAWAFIVFTVVFALVGLMGLLPIPPLVHALIVVILTAIPLALFGILPNAVVADIAEADGRQSGNFKAGIFFGIRTFEMNVGITIANILLPSLLSLGKSVDNPAGVRLSAVVAAALCLVGLVLFLRYSEKEVNAQLGPADGGS